jgi:hypothetical protein
MTAAERRLQRSDKAGRLVPKQLERVVLPGD